jgi:hypothetical protein
MPASQYDTYQPQGELSEPVWPSEPIEKLLGIALRDRLIDSASHPVLAHLAGRF